MTFTPAQRLSQVTDILSRGLLRMIEQKAQEEELLEAGERESINSKKRRS